MKVVHIVTDLNVGGAQVMLHRLVAGLQAQGVGNTIISLGGMTEHFEPLRRQGVDLQCLGMQARRRGVTGFLRLCQLLRSARPDVVHTWMYHANLIGGVAAILLIGTAAWYWLYGGTPPVQYKTGLVDRVTRALLMSVSSARRAFLRLAAPIGFASGLMNTTPIVAMLVPAIVM
mgnify:CR=1 FL=1